ncbi:SH3 domain-binding glutamic acid-rich protein homolog [Zophobas morio]|uniref:SH3 domain-binding glutamic acid-rich protein homolog n=1 Tax=Zophobas morio TaxID=2755281 RepID=UPI0030839868
MVVKAYMSSISGNKEVKKQDTELENYSTSSGGTISDPNPRHSFSPQIFNDDDYCGDYDQFDMANKIDEMEKNLKLESIHSVPIVTSNAEIKLRNREIQSEETPQNFKETKGNKEEESKDDNVPDNNENTNETVE